MADLLLYSLIAGLFSLTGGFLVLWRSDIASKIMLPLIAFAAGAFMGIGFLDLLPEAVEAVDEPHNIFIAAVVGFSLFFVLERLLMRFTHRHHDDVAQVHSEHTASLSYLVVVSDTAHNFLDGIAIALAYMTNPALGLSTALAVAAHELPQEVGDFAILLDRGWDKMKIIVVNVLSSLAATLGVVVGYFGFAQLGPLLPYLLGLMAGIFIYIGASDLVPELQDRAKHRDTVRILAPFFFGLLTVGYLVSLAHGSA